MPDDTTTTLTSPVNPTAASEGLDEQGVALCLSGGGYRAMLFHLGALWRLNELAFLPRVTRVSSVSGGSITAGVLGVAWHRLHFGDSGVADNFSSEVVDPIRRLADDTVDEGAILGGILTPGSIADKVANAYRQHLFGSATLQDLPQPNMGPRFVINATSIQTGALWRFSQLYMADYKVGVIHTPTVEMAVAVAASSAFPPVLSPLKLDLDPSAFDQAQRGPLHQPPFTTTAVLTDGGVYDNLGLETAWKRCRMVLVSDGGGQMAPDPEPHVDWVRQALRINDVIDNQVRALRKRQVIASLQRAASKTDDWRTGSYWGIRGQVADYGLADALSCPPDQTLVLASTPTRLKQLDPTLQERLINWGYAICDTAMRKWVLHAPVPPGFPYPASALGDT